MDLGGNSGQGIADAQLASFIEQENQKQQFQMVIHALTAKCWDLCSPSISARLDSRSESCLTHCVDRFLDSSKFIVDKLGQEGAAHGANMHTDGFSTSTDFSLGTPDIGLEMSGIPTDSQFSSSQQEKKSGWKFW